MKMPKELEPATTKEYFEIWKVCVDLHKFHDQLKQTRIQRFTAVQIALAGGFTISMRSLAEANGLSAYVIAGSCLAACFAGYCYAAIMLGMDARAAAFVRVVKNQIQHVERVVAPAFGELQYLPYRGQRLVLSKDAEIMLTKDGEYVNGKDKSASTAAASEQRILWLVTWGWVLGFVAAGGLAIFRLGFFGI